MVEKRSSLEDSRRNLLEDSRRDLTQIDLQMSASTNRPLEYPPRTSQGNKRLSLQYLSI